MTAVIGALAEAVIGAVSKRAEAVIGAVSKRAEAVIGALAEAVIGALAEATSKREGNDFLLVYVRLVFSAEARGADDGVEPLEGTLGFLVYLRLVIIASGADDGVEGAEPLGAEALCYKSIYIIYGFKIQNTMKGKNIFLFKKTSQLYSQIFRLDRQVRHRYPRHICRY